jgi:hypothetical protein
VGRSENRSCSRTLRLLPKCSLAQALADNPSTLEQTRAPECSQSHGTFVDGGGSARACKVLLRLGRVLESALTRTYFLSTFQPKFGYALEWFTDLYTPATIDFDWSNQHGNTYKNIAKTFSAIVTVLEDDLTSSD